MEKTKNRIRELRINRGFKSSADVARIIGAKYQSYASWEAQRHNPNLYHQVKLAEFFECSVDYLLGADK